MRSLYSIYLCQFESIRSGLFVIKRQFQGYFLVVKLKSSLWKLYGRRHKLINGHWMSMSKMTTVMFLCRYHNRVIPSPSWLLTGFITQQAGWVLLVEQKLLIFPGNLSSILVFSWALYWGKNSKKKKQKKKNSNEKRKRNYKNKTLLSGNWVFIA